MVVSVVWLVWSMGCAFIAMALDVVCIFHEGDSLTIVLLAAMKQSSFFKYAINQHVS